MAGRAKTHTSRQTRRLQGLAPSLNRFHPSQSTRPPLQSPMAFDQLWDIAMDAMARAVAHFGSRRAMADSCGLPAGYEQWRVCPPFYCIRLAARTGYDVTPWELRPDIFAYPEDGVPRELRAEVLRRHAERARMASEALARHYMTAIDPPKATDLGDEPNRSTDQLHPVTDS